MRAERIEDHEVVVLITGDRNWQNADFIYRVLSKLPKNAVIVHGACRGADLIADEAARQLGLRRIGHPAHWTHTPRCDPDCREVTGRAAGMIRNHKMYDAYREHIAVVLAFHPDLTKSKGTKGMVKYAERHGSRVLKFTGNEELVNTGS